MAKILVVDDERSVREAIRFELEDDGYEVFHASDCIEAISVYHAFNCDMIIADIFLNKGNGIQLMNLINKDKKEVPFIAITAFPDSQLASQAKSILKDRFFEKPFYAPLLKKKIFELLKQSEVQKSS
jgi:DNA-binding NtrC family response regulator